MLQTPTQKQNAIITFYNKALEKQGIKIIRKTGPSLQLRAKITGDFAKLLNAIHPCKLVNQGRLGEPISGTYDAYILTIGASIPGANKGDQCYFVQATKTTAVTSQKELSPANLKIAGRVIGITSFKRMVLEAVKQSKTDTAVKSFLSDLMDASETNQGHIRGTMIDSLSRQDFNMISNDFGEVSGAWWFAKVHNKKVSAIEYPTASNQALVDYFAHVGKTQRIAVSAKAGGGSAPSIKSIADALRKTQYPEAKKEQARKAIIAIADDTVVEGIIAAAKLLQIPAYTYLKNKIFKHDFTAVDIEKYMAKFTGPEQVLPEFAEYFKTIINSASEKSIGEIFRGNLKRNGILISPMGYSLVTNLNQNPDYLSVLNDAAKSVQLTQIYMQINERNKSVKYQIHEFNQANFRFEYHSNAKNPSNNRIGFELIK